MVAEALDAGFTLLGTSAVKGSVVLMTAAAVVRLMRRKSAVTRRLVWSMAIASLLVLPALELALPEATLIRADIPIARMAPGATVPSHIASFDQAAPDVSRTPVPDASPPVSPAPGNAPLEQNPIAQLLEKRGVARTIAIVWLAGIMVVLTLIGLSWVRLRLLARKATQVTDAGVLEVMRRSARLLGVERDVRLSISHQAGIPMAWGIVRPSIVLPQSAVTWSRDRMESVFLHELAHVRNGDPIGRLVAALVCAIHWYNPLAWVAARRFEAEGEECCDDLVILAGRPPVSYASDLLELATGLRGHRRLTATAALFGESSLSTRIRAILASSRPRSRPSRRTLGVLRSLAAGFVLTVAALRPAPMRDATAASVRSIGDTSAIEQNALVSTGPSGADRSDVGETGVATAEPLTVAQDHVLAGPVGSVASHSSATVLEVDQRTPALPDVAPIRSARRSRAVLDYRAILALSTSVMASRLSTDESADDRRAMAWGLGQKGRSQGGALAMALQSDADPAVREMSAWSLGETRGGHTSELAAAVRADPDAEVRASAFWALEQNGVSAAMPALESAMRDAHTPLRRRALWYAGFHGARDRAPGLVEALSHPDSESRRTAAWSLGSLRAGQHSRSLVPLLADRDRGVREAAAWALHRFDTAESRAAIAAAAETSAEAQHILARVERTGRPVEWSWSWTMPRPRTRP